MSATQENENSVTYERIVEAYNRINPILMRTPVHVSSTADELVGKKVYFKCENFQKTGSFKARGALNSVLAKISRSSCANNYSGCITHSSGNHGTALAWAAKYESMPCTIVVPENTPKVKVRSILEYGAQLEFCENNPVSRLEVCERLARERNQLIIPPYDDYDIMCGQGTLAFEFLEQVPSLDALVVSISGGGLISGISVCAKRINPSIRIIGVEPEGKRLAECLRRNERNIDQKPTSYLNTLAEGIRTEQCGKLTFGVLSQHVKPDDIITVTDDEMIEATKFVFTRMKMVVELAAGAAVAAAFKMKEGYPELRHVGVILCGGNIDIENLPWKANNQS